MIKTTYKDIALATLKVERTWSNSPKSIEALVSVSVFGEDLTTFNHSCSAVKTEDSFTTVYRSLLAKFGGDIIEETVQYDETQVQLDKIRAKFNKKHYIEINGVEWDVSRNATSDIDGVIRLSEMLGLTNVTLYDKNNKKHTMPIDEAKNILIKIAIQFQTIFEKKQRAMNEITTRA